MTSYTETSLLSEGAYQGPVVDIHQQIPCNWHWRNIRGQWEPLQVSIRRWYMMSSTEMHIWKYGIWTWNVHLVLLTCLWEKTGVTKYRKISSVHYRLSDPKVRLLAKILNKSNVSRCTYYWLQSKAAASFKDYMPAQAVWHECRYLSCQHNVTSKTVSSQISKHSGKA